jgi:ribosomal protein S18 acetylase RimI-like enzyme
VSQLPSRFTARAAEPGDADGILAVGVARDIEDLGYPDYDIDDVREELAEAREACVVSDGGTIVAYAFLEGDDARVAVHPDACGNGIGRWLLEWAEARGENVLRQEASGSNDAARRLLEEAGYALTQHYWRMERDLAEPVEPVPWPAGVEARSYGPQDATTARALIDEAFAPIPGHVSRPLRDRYAPELSTVAGDFAGIALCERWEDGQGYVAYLATAGDWRGRGLGRALLATSLEKMRAAGLERAALSVNARNESATRLYESVGMRVGSRTDRYEKRL